MGASEQRRCIGRSGGPRETRRSSVTARSSRQATIPGTEDRPGAAPCPDVRLRWERGDVPRRAYSRPRHARGVGAVSASDGCVPGDAGEDSSLLISRSSSWCRFLTGNFLRWLASARRIFVRGVSFLAVGGFRVFFIASSRPLIWGVAGGRTTGSFVTIVNRPVQRRFCNGHPGAPPPRFADANTAGALGSTPGAASPQTNGTPHRRKFSAASQAGPGRW